MYGGNLQLVYDLKKIHEGAIGVKASGSWASGFGGHVAEDDLPKLIGTALDTIKNGRFACQNAIQIIYTNSR